MCPVPLTVRGSAALARSDARRNGYLEKLGALFSEVIKGDYSFLTDVETIRDLLDCDEGEICEGGSGRRKLRFGNIHDGCCRIADEL